MRDLITHSVAVAIGMIAGVVIGWRSGMKHILRKIYNMRGKGKF